VSALPPRLEVERLSLMEESKLDRLRLKAAKAAAEIFHIDELGENRHSLHSVPISKTQRVGFGSTGWGRLVAEAWPRCVRAVAAYIWQISSGFGYDLLQGGY
jgi:hypothetical protein